MVVVKNSEGDRVVRWEMTYEIDQWVMDHKIHEMPYDLFISKFNIWISVKDELPTEMDKDYLVLVKNKNKESGIYLHDIANFTSDGTWSKQNTWEDVTHWAELPKPPEE